MFVVSKKSALFCLCAIAFLCFFPEQHGHAREGGFKQKIMEKRIKKKIEELKKEQESKGSKEGFYVRGKGQSINETINGRTFITYLPQSFDKTQNLPLLIVLHGGMGSGAQIKNYIGLEPYADQGNFILVFADGTQVARKLSDRFKGWNAGGCCGVPEADNVDDIGFLSDVIDYMHTTYKVDKNQVFGTGHSNGAMMTLRVMCETDLYNGAITLSGTLQMDVKTCPSAQGAKIMNIHGSEDKNLPPEGGHTSAGINKKTLYTSQTFTQEVFKKSGGHYELVLLEGVDHSPNSINEGLIKVYGKTVPEMIVDYLKLDLN